jgi:signal recognition particle subunit SRP54
MPGMPGGGKRAKAHQQAKKSRTKRGSGNPAKRAQAQQGGSARPAPAASPFGNPAAAPTGPSAPTADGFELPKELRDLL